jgi:hypothetical protein
MTGARTVATTTTKTTLAKVYPYESGVVLHNDGRSGGMDIRLLTLNLISDPEVIVKIKARVPVECHGFDTFSSIIFLDA